jgi:hypothetical protein
VLEIVDEDTLEVTDELYRAALAATAQPRSRPSAAELAGLAGWRGAHHHEDVVDVDPVELRDAIADVVSAAVRDLVAAETRRTINRFRGRLD